MLLDILPVIFRDITEETKKGNSPYQALEKIYKRYDKNTQIFLKKILFEKKLGREIEEILEKENIPLIFKQAFFVLDQAERIGSDPATLMDISDFINKIDSARRILNMKIKFYIYSSILVSALLGFAIGMISGVVTNMYTIFYSLISSSPISLGFFNLTNEGKILIDILFITSFINSALLGILAGLLNNNITIAARTAMICLIVNFITVNLGNMINFFSF